MAFHSLILSKPDYAAPAWQSVLSATNLFCLDCLQDRSLRLMTGQLESTPMGVFRLEADVQSYHTCSNRLILNASEKELHSTNDLSKPVALADDIPQHLQNRSSSRRKAEEISTLLPPAPQHRENIIHFLSPPWQHSTPYEG